MNIVIFGLTISSSWGNGHATLWRGLCKAMGRRGHKVNFFEKDVPYYAATRDLFELPGGGSLHLYARIEDIRAEVRRGLNDADLAMCTSYCADGKAAAALILESRADIKAFYDMDTPITLRRLGAAEEPAYMPEGGLAEFDLVLSYTGGRALSELQTRLGARCVAPLYGSVDPEVHFPVQAVAEYRSDLSYLGTFAADRQATLDELFVKTARSLPAQRFAIGGAQYPDEFPWTPNIFFLRHLPPALHPAFFCSSRATLNVTRGAMAEYGYCPSGRFFEAAACGTPLITDSWDGLETFLLPGSELLTASTSQDVVDALELTDLELGQMAVRARERTMEEHTAGHRVTELESICASLPRAMAHNGI